MEDCTVTTETINEVHHTYYTRDGAIVAECRRSTTHGYSFEVWYRDGKCHRDNGPAMVFCNAEGQKFQEQWWHNGKEHRDDGPAEIIYANGQITGEFWWRDGKKHRDDGPAVIYYENGQKIGEYWYRDDKEHRDGCLPAVIWYEDDQITKICWYRYGELCPKGKLASIVYQNIDSAEWYFIGVKSTRNIDELRDAVKGDAIHDALRPLPIPIRQAIILHYCYQ